MNRSVIAAALAHSYSASSATAVARLGRSGSLSTMCLGIPGRIIEFIDEARQLARVEVASVRRIVHVGLLLPEGLAPGDWVLIHVGFAMSKIDEDEAERTIAFLKSLGDEYEQELTQLSASRIE